MILYTLVVVSTALTLVLSLALGIFTLARNPKSKVHILWFLTMMVAAIWAGGYLALLFSSTDEKAAALFSVVYLGATFVPVLYFHFVASFLYLEKKFKPMVVFGYIVATILVVLVAFTKYIIQGVKYLEGFGRYEEVTVFPGFTLYLVYFLIFVFGSLWLLIKYYTKSDGIRRKQIFYLLLASVLGFGGAGWNWFPQTFGIFPYGQLVAWLYPFFVTYGIFVDEFRIKIKF